MKKLSCFVLAVVSLAATAQAALGDVGEWSKPVQGLSARTVFGDGKTFVGTRITEVYLELKNVSDIAGTLEFTFDYTRSLRFKLISEDGREIPNQASAIDGMLRGPFRVSIPSGGSLKFPVNWHGHAIPRDAGTALPFFEEFWVIPFKDQKKYSLVGTLKILDTETGAQRPFFGGRSWSGIISTPSVVVPTQPTISK